MIMKRFIILFGIALFSISGCGKAPENPSAATDTTVSYTVFEGLQDESTKQEYFSGHDEIENSELYIPNDKLFAIQLPENAAICEDFNDTTQVLTYTVTLPDLGHISVNRESREYISMGEQELQEQYYESWLGENPEIEFTIQNLITIHDEFGSEIGRSFDIVYSDGQVMLRKELVYNDQIVTIIGQPLLLNSEKTQNAVNELKKYIDSFELLNG